MLDPAAAQLPAALAEASEPASEPVSTRPPGAIIGDSPALRRVLDEALKVSSAHATVLLTGESGTGKELIARKIHTHSSRAACPFVAVNCGAIPEELLESELFGHVKGAFTHAVSARQGRFALADGGTIFLDEIGDMSPALQVKLLRVLQDGCFEPVGSSRTRQVDARVIAATNQKLDESMQTGRFRRDLFYRLNVVPIQLPPLRERREDVPLLIEHFLTRIAKRDARAPGRISPEALERLSAHDWPGNVRELENLIERLVILRAGERIELDELPHPLHGSPLLSEAPRPRVPETGIRFADVVGRFEEQLIRRALDMTGWNKSRAAQLLGLNRTTMLDLIKKKGLAPDPIKRPDADRVA